MLGRSVGPKPARPSKEPHFGDQVPAFSPDNVPRLGENVLQPQQGSPAFSGGREHFQTDAERAEHQQRLAKQHTYQVCSSHTHRATS